MKISYTLLLIIWCSASNLYSQAYQFSTYTNNYQYLNNPTSLNQGLSWDDPNFTVPIGFNFHYFGNSIDTVLIAYGFGGTLLTSLNSSGIASFLSPYGSDLIDRGFDFLRGPGSPGSESPISYELQGTSGNRILKIEWRNAGFYSDLSVNGTAAADSVNFQLWFYEGSNVFEVHMGPNSIQSPQLSYDGFPGPDVLLAPSVDMINGRYNANFYCLGGLPFHPQLHNRSPNDTLLFIRGNIPAGRVYRFQPLSTELKKSELAEQIIIYPNPSDGKIKIERPSDLIIKAINLYNANGGKLDALDPNETNYDLSYLAKGIYQLQIISPKGVVLKKIVFN